MRAALIDEIDGKIQNIIELPDDYPANGGNVYVPPEGMSVEFPAPAEAQINGYFKNGVWEKPTPSADPAPEPTSPSLEDRVLALEEEIQGMRDRAAATNVTNTDAVKIRDALVGNPNA